MQKQHHSNNNEHAYHIVFILLNFFEEVGFSLSFFYVYGVYVYVVCVFACKYLLVCVCMWSLGLILGITFHQMFFTFTEAESLSRPELTVMASLAGVNENF